MLRGSDSKVELAGIERANTSPLSNLDTYIGTREAPAREGIDSESCDREIQPSQQSYEAEEF
jgi:hypothetical protein